MIDHRSTSLPECGPTEFPAMNLVFLFFPPIHSWIKILCYNRQPQPRLLILAQPQPRFLKYSQQSKNRNRGFLKSDNRSITTGSQPNSSTPRSMYLWTHESFLPPKTEPDLHYLVRVERSCSTFISLKKKSRVRENDHVIFPVITSRV